MTVPATFHRIDVPVGSLPRATRFYGATFGWTFATDGPTRVQMAGRGSPGAPDWEERAPEVRLVVLPPAAAAGRVGLAVGVDDIGAAVGRAVAAGGAALGDVEVIDDIRTAVVADTEGNSLGLWQPAPGDDFWWRPHDGARIVDGATFQYIELEALDLDRASAFYGDVFGWAFAPPHASHNPSGPVPSAGRALHGTDVVRYCTTARPELGLRRVARIAPPGPTPPAVGVLDLGDAIDAVTRAGGALVGHDPPSGAVAAATIADTEGNHLRLMTPLSTVAVAWRPHAVGGHASHV